MVGGLLGDGTAGTNHLVLPVIGDVSGGDNTGGLLGIGSRSGHYFLLCY